MILTELISNLPKDAVRVFIKEAYETLYDSDEVIFKVKGEADP